MSEKPRRAGVLRGILGRRGADDHTSSDTFPPELLAPDDASPAAGGRSLCRGLALFEDLTGGHGHARLSTAQARAVVTAFPSPAHSSLAEEKYWRRLVHLVHPEFYWAQMTPDVRPSVLGAEPTDRVGRAVVHYLTVGVRQRLRPSIFFHEEWYLDALTSTDLTADPDTAPFLHFVTAGWDAAVVPTPLLDPDFYTVQHPNLSLSGRLEAVRHFIVDGCREPWRRPHPVSVSRLETRGRKLPIGEPVLLRAFVRDGRLVTPAPDDAMIAARSRTVRVDDPDIRALVAHAGTIEPSVLQDTGPRTVALPPFLQPLTSLVERAESVRRSLRYPRADVVLLVSRSGDTGGLADAVAAELRRARSSLRVLVIATDEAGRDARVDDGQDSLDLVTPAQGLPDRQHVRLLLDVVRGVQARAVLNVDSRLGWQLTGRFGRQLSSWARLVAWVPADLPSAEPELPDVRDQLGFLSDIVAGSHQQVEDLTERQWLPETLPCRLVVSPSPADIVGLLNLPQESTDER